MDQYLLIILSNFCLNILSLYYYIFSLHYINYRVSTQTFFFNIIVITYIWYFKVYFFYPEMLYLVDVFWPNFKFSLHSDRFNIINILEKAREPGSQRRDPILAIFYGFAAKSRSGQAIHYDFINKILQRPRYS